MDLILDYIRNFWQVFLMMAPWLLLGYLLAGVIALLMPQDWVKRNLSGKGFAPVLKAVLLGIPLPLCSCGVIPVAASLRKEGADRGATGAFYIATPQTGVDNIIVTWSMMGGVLAVLRPVLAFLSGITGGLLIKLFCRESAPEKVEEKPHCCCCCHAKNSPKTAEPETKPDPLVFVLKYGFDKMMKSTSPSLIVGILIAALIQQILPPDFGKEYLGDKVYLQFIAVIAIAVPLYVCSNASVPVAASLLAKGFSPGAALLFLIVGPAISSVSITSMKSVLGGKAVFFAIIAVSFWTLLAGIIVNCFDISFSFPENLCCHAGGTGIFPQICGAVLALLITRALISRYLGKNKAR